MINTGGGTFNPKERFIYFIASGVGRLQHAHDIHQNLLTAVNEIGSQSEMQKLSSWAKEGKRIFIDSGVFNLAMEHAKKHNVSHNIGLSMPPDQIDGFGELFDKYVDIVRHMGDDVWGYIEIDQGGRENKIKTRTRLESMGLRPIPVYHPFTDGWDYFDYLAERYDRICFGNVVKADRATRVRLVATAWERMRKYPNLWIHLLGLTPNQWLNAFPVSSGDSSSWLSSVRWTGGYREQTALRSIGGGLPQNFKYKLGCEASSEMGADKAVKMAGYGSYINQRNWHNFLGELTAVGCDPLPEAYVSEG